MTTTVQLFKCQEIRGFFFGSRTHFAQAGPANAAAFLGYEAALKSIAYCTRD